MLEPSGKAVPIVFPLSPVAGFDGKVDKATCAQDSTCFLQGESCFVRRKMKQRGVRPHPTYRTVAQRKAAGVGLDSRDAELAQTSAKHADGEVERYDSEPSIAKLGGITPGTSTDVERRGTRSEALGELLEPAQDWRAVAGIPKEAGRNQIIRLSRSRDALVHTPRGLTPGA